MFEELLRYLSPYYLQIKFVHLLFVGMWIWSISAAYTPDIARV